MASANRWSVALLLASSLALAPYGQAQKAPGGIPSTKEGLTLRPVDGRDPVMPATTLAVPAAITAVTSVRENDSVVVAIETSAPVKHQVSRLTAPDRLVIDFANAENRVPFYSLSVNEAPVRKVRVSQFQTGEPRMTRIVLDLDEGTPRPEIVPVDQVVRVVFPRGAASQPEASTPRSTARPAPEPQQAAPARKRDVGVPVIRDLGISEIPRSAVSAVAPPETKPQTPKPQVAAAPVVMLNEAPPPPQPQAPRDSRYSGQPLTLDLVDISLVDFFRLMAEEGGLNVVMDPEIKGTISIKVVKVPWDQIFDAALENNGLDKKIEGNLVRIARKETLQNEAKQVEALKKANLLAAELETRIKRLNYAKAASLIPTLADQKTVRGTVVTDERTNSLIMTDIPASLERMARLVESIDIPQPQVEIEARIVSSTRDFARDIGIQFGFVQGNLERVTVGGPNTFGTIGGTRPSATPKSTYVGGSPSRGRGASNDESTESASTSTGTGSNNSGNYNVNLPAPKAYGGIGLSIGNIFDTFLLDAAITAGENRGLAKLISQPKVTAQNNAPAMITQGLRFPVQIIANNTVTVQFQNAALTLTVTPQITYEGNIMLDLKVENNTPDFSRQVNGIPSIRTSESTTRVLVGDGGTTVLGGILIENETKQEDKVPGLASLPIIGNAFRRTMVSHTTQEVMFFVTPKIVK